MEEKEEEHPYYSEANEYYRSNREIIIKRFEELKDRLEQQRAFELAHLRRTLIMQGMTVIDPPNS